MKTFAFVVLTLLGVCLAAPLLNVGCRSMQALPALEDVSQAEADACIADVALISRVAAARLVKDGSASVETVAKIAGALELVAADPLAVGGPSFITDALRRDGWTDDEIMLAFEVAESALRQQFNLGSSASPLGPRARSLLLAVSGSLRVVAAGPVP